MYLFFHGATEKFIDAQPEPLRSKALIERAEYNEMQARFYAAGYTGMNHRREARRLRRLAAK